jgi:predicted outer membrane repeat protein
VIRRLHFKNGLATTDGGAIYTKGTLTLESCVFSGNRTTGSGAAGGAVCSINTLTIRGCTFYGNNTTDGGGGAVYFSPLGGETLTMTGNLFYGNTSYPVGLLYGGTVSASYNVVDVAFGTGSNDAGWTGGTGDTYITTGDPIESTTFKPKTGSPGIADIGIVPSDLADFPETDFYGKPRTFPGGAAGAINQQ